MGVGFAAAGGSSPGRLIKKSRKGCMKGKGGPDNASCQYRGVRQRTWGKWVAEIREPKCGARLWLGTFASADEAARAYDEAAMQYYGACARLNLPSSASAATAAGVPAAAGGTNIEAEAKASPLLLPLPPQQLPSRKRQRMTEIPPSHSSQPGLGLPHAKPLALLAHSRVQPLSPPPFPSPEPLNKDDAAKLVVADDSEVNGFFVPYSPSPDLPGLEDVFTASYNQRFDNTEEFPELPEDLLNGSYDLWVYREDTGTQTF